MFVTTYGSALIGIEARKIHVEVNWLLTGKASSLVGLPDSAIRESLERIESAFKTNGYKFPAKRPLYYWVLQPAHCLTVKKLDGSWCGSENYFLQWLYQSSRVCCRVQPG